jgi:hypothetical protein
MPAVMSGLGKAKRVPSLSVGPVVSPVLGEGTRKGSGPSGPFWGPLGADLRSPWIAGLMQDIPYRGVLGAPG